MSCVYTHLKAWPEPLKHWDNVGHQALQSVPVYVHVVSEGKGGHNKY